MSEKISLNPGQSPGIRGHISLYPGTARKIGKKNRKKKKIWEKWHYLRGNRWDDFVPRRVIFGSMRDIPFSGWCIEPDPQIQFQPFVLPLELAGRSLRMNSRHPNTTVCLKKLQCRHIVDTQLAEPLSAA